VQLFFLQIQGGGVVRLANDEKILIGFMGKNNYPYHAIGQDLPLQKPINAEKIKRWLYEHKDRQKEMMEKNPSYIFFQEIRDNTVRGAGGIALVPGYSLAVDNDAIPYGAPLWLDTSLPDKTPFRRLMIAADSGSAIKGAVRGDIFFGAGKIAENMAGNMQNPGRYYIFLPKEANAKKEK
jgi:membrane-bound lytic murein transglycosylase A